VERVNAIYEVCLDHVIPSSDQPEVDKVGTVIRRAHSPSTRGSKKEKPQSKDRGGRPG